MTLIYKLTLAIAVIFSGVLCEIKGEFEQKHMHDAHQIEVTDEITFFKLHDVDGDGFWDEEELRSMYGFERDIDPDANHIKLIIDRVYKDMDMNKDRFISMDEYITSKLPSITKKEEKKEEEMKQQEEMKQEKKKKNNSDQKVIVNNKRKPQRVASAAGNQEVPVAKTNVFNQEGANYVPNKFRA